MTAKKQLEKIAHVCEVGVMYKSKVKPENRVSLNNSEEAYKLFLSFYQNAYSGKIEQKEIFTIALLDRKNKCLGIALVGEGSSIQAVVDIQYIGRLALLTNAQAVMLCHNHPSGNLNPSPHDIKVSKNLKMALDLFSIAVFDHLIISEGGYYSLADNDDF